VNSGELLISEK